MRKSNLALGLAAALLATCGDDDGSTPTIDGGNQPTADADPAAPDAMMGTPDATPVNCNPVSGIPTLALQDLGGGFNGPVAAVVPPGSTDIYVLEKSGRRISIFRDGATLPTPFLDASNVVISNNSGSERGLLGLAFNKDYATNGRFYIYYISQAVAGAGIASGDIVLAEYTRSAGNPDVADPTGTRLLHEPHPNQSNHNGGWIAIGPDGMLYMGLGDGGGGGDSEGNSRDKQELLSKILRLDVSVAGAATAPADNPFVGNAEFDARIYLWGLRNPWRNSFDRMTGDLYIADVGQDAYEEINVIPASSNGGEDLGWNIMEGVHCFQGGCNMAGLTLPVYEYPHNGTGASITGGFVYRGCKMPDLHGTYFFSDVVDGFTRSFKWNGAGGVTDVTDYPQFNGQVIYGYGEDAEGELLLLDGSDGHMYRLVPQ